LRQTEGNTLGANFRCGNDGHFRGEVMATAIMATNGAPRFCEKFSAELPRQFNADSCAAP
jgi:hypothetical protein